MSWRPLEEVAIRLRTWDCGHDRVPCDFSNKDPKDRVILPEQRTANPGGRGPECSHGARVVLGRDAERGVTQRGCSEAAEYAMIAPEQRADDAERRRPAEVCRGPLYLLLLQRSGAGRHRRLRGV